MQDYEKLLNDRAGKEPVSIQGIYDMIYAPTIDAYKIRNFSISIKLIDSAVISDGIRTVVVYQKYGEKDSQIMLLSDVEPLLREVMVIGRRLRNQIRDKNLDNDYAHFGLEDYRGPLYVEKNLTMPTDGRRAGDLAEIGIAIREYLKLYKQNL